MTKIIFVCVSKNIKIDVVSTLIEPLEFINSSFDLDCCQRTYGGKELYYPHDRIGEGNIVRESNVYHRYYNDGDGITTIIKLISNIDQNLLPDEIKNAHRQITNKYKNKLISLKSYRLFYRCLKYIIKGIKIPNFKMYFACYYPYG